MFLWRGGTPRAHFIREQRERRKAIGRYRHKVSGDLARRRRQRFLF